MKVTGALGLALAALVVGSPVASQGTSHDPARLYGRVTTYDGSMYEGFIRWTRNEGGVFDILHASKPIPRAYREDARRLGARPRERSFEIFGIEIPLGSDGSVYTSSATAGIRLGHVSSLEPLSGSRARLLLKSGQELELSGSTDLGSGVDEIKIEDRWGSTVELEWRDVRIIDFLPAPARSSRWGDRLYGTLHTRDGERFTGYVVWDMDELFGADVLDGDDRDDRDREIPFSEIAALARYSSSATLVQLRNGDRLELRGSNDVNSGNRDILVADPALGEVRVDWSEFDRLELTAPPADAGFALDGGRRLRGTVTDRRGGRHTGLIRWDNDEEYTWEILDGNNPSGIEMDIEFGNIAGIERNGYRSSIVTLRDGRRFDIRGSNDVDEGNKGIYIEGSNGALILVTWDEFVGVEFEG